MGDVTADDEALTELFARSGAIPAPEPLRQALQQRLFGTDHASGRRVGRYVLQHKLGAGGMGEVFCAHDPELERTVAIKLIRLRDSDTEASIMRRRTRMLREAQALARVRHPNVVTVFDVGIHQNELFIAMELIEGITLKTWMQSQSRSWREIVEIFVQAGRGLLAAHQAGLIHRDFKPTNVVIGRDRTVRVIDFGLVIPDQSDSVTPSPEGGETYLSPTMSDPITRAGSVMGTVAYMSPEQLGREPLDPRSDQFSFCVTLFEALFGQRPYSGSSPHHLMYNLLDGKVADVGRAGVPRWLKRVCLRGLSPRPSARYRDMQQLLVALARGLDRRRRWTFAAGLGGTLATGLVAASLWPAKVSPCTTDQLQAHSIWQGAIRTDVEKALARSELPFSRERFATIDQMMANDSANHLDAVVEVCRQTEDGLLSPELAQLRTECLAEREQTVRARLEDLAQAGAETVVQATESLGELPSPTRCLQLTPAAHGEAGRVETLQRALDHSIDQQLAAAQMREKAGKYREALELVSSATSAADRGASDPIRARAWMAQARLETQLGRTTEATRSRERAMRLAERTHDQELWLSLVSAKIRALGVEAFRVDEATWWRNEAQQVLAEHQPHPLRAAELESAIADLEWIAGNYEAAISAQRRALTLREHLLGPDHLDVAQSLGDLATTLADNGDLTQAKHLLERALKIRETALGHNHPLVASTLNNLGTVQRQQHDLAGARNSLERSLAIKRLHWGKHHPNTARALHNLGRLAREQGDLAGAVSLYREALEIRTQALGPDHPDVATTANAMGVALKKLGQFDEARQALQRALDIRRDTLGPNHRKLAATHNSLGLLLLELEKPREALAHFHRAVDIRELHLEADDPKLTWARRNLGHAALLAGNPTLARQQLSAVHVRDTADMAAGTTKPDDLARTKLWLAQASAPSAVSQRLLSEARTLAHAANDPQLVSEIDRFRSDSTDDAN